tara:strand:+ start:50 stop:418 length:369 start_codon:yes stop_codon:yes gene_type:complete
MIKLDKKTKDQGQKYSNNVIGSMKDILNIKDEDRKQEEIFNYGISLQKSKNITINYLISWGGPAYRLQIVFNTEEEEVKSIKPQYQDWGTYWTTMQTTEEQDKILKEFVSNLHLDEEYLYIK